MKKLVLNSIIASIIFFFFSCGGVIGNIQKYEFAISPDSLKKVLNSVYIKYPYLMENDSVNKYFNNDGETFYYVFNRKQDTTVFECHIITYDERDTINTYNNRYTIDLSLTSAVTWGKTMKLATQMSFFEKRRYRQLFEDNILPKIKAELK